MASINNFDEALVAAKNHFECMLQIVSYGKQVGENFEVFNVAIECEDHGVILADWDNPRAGEKTKAYACSECGSRNVMQDAFVAVNDPSDVRLFDAMLCDDCGSNKIHTI
jgi:Zn finger protein HypA/HybF involved in hydrogenase expression